MVRAICEKGVGRFSLSVSTCLIMVAVFSVFAVAQETKVGFLTAGSNNYPNVALMRIDAAADFRDDKDIQCTLIDDERRYAYLGTFGNPARVIKMDLGTDDEDLPVQVASLLLDWDVRDISCGVIDSEAGFAWFGTDGNPAKIIKVALGEGSAPPACVAVTTLPPTDVHLSCAVLDKENHTAYFGTNRTPARVVKMELPGGHYPAVRVGSLVLDSQESTLSCALFDAASGHCFFAAPQTGRLYKVFSAAAGQLPELRGYVTGLNGVSCGVLVAHQNCALFGTFSNPSKVFKVGLGEASAPPQLLASVTLGSALDAHLHTAVLDSSSGEVLFGAGGVSTPASVIKMSVGQEGAAPVRLIRSELDDPDMMLGNAVIDDARGHVWFSNLWDPARMVKFSQGGPYSLVYRGSTELKSGESKCAVMLMDSEAQYAWTGTETTPGRIIKVALHEGRQQARRLSSIDLAEGENNILSGVMDEERGFGWFGAYHPSQGKIVMVALGEGDAPPERHGALTLPSTEIGIRSAVIDPACEYAYFGTLSTPPKVIKVALGTGAQLPTRVGAASFGTVKDGFRSAAYDAKNHLIYFGTDAGHVVRVDPGVGNAPPAILGSIRELDYMPSSFCSVLLDPESGYGWFGTMSTPGRIMTVVIDPSRTLERTHVLTLPEEEYGLYAAVRNAESNRAYYGTNSQPGRVVAVDLGDGDEVPVRVGSITLTDMDSHLRDAVLHPNGGTVWFSSNKAPGSLVRIGLGHSNAIHGSRITLSQKAAVTKMHFYSHQALGSLRLAIYDTAASPNLLWQSEVLDNTESEGWITSSIDTGHPASLILPAGDYWLAYQVDRPEAIPSWTAGSPGIGFSVIHPFEAFPEMLTEGTSRAIALNDSQWSLHLSYDNHIQPPSTAGTTAISSESITWIWQDHSSNETGFKVWADAGNSAPVTLRATLPPNTVSWTWDGLTSNCQYSFQTAAAFIFDSSKTSLISAYTLPAAPEVDVTIRCNVAPDTPRPGESVFNFHNPAGFGAGSPGNTHPKISAYRYQWNTASAYEFSGNETLWSGGSLSLGTSTYSQNYYLHIQSLNAVGKAGGTLSYGPFIIDADPPAAPIVSGPALTREPRPEWTWQPGGGGTGLYKVELNGSGIWAEQNTLSFVPETDLEEGSHTLRVCERDEAGNWSAPGSFTVSIDLSALSAAILPLTPLETGASILSFEVIFSQEVGVSFTQETLSIQGSFTGTLSLSGEGTVYRVDLELHDRESDGEVGIRIEGDMISDTLGNVYGGGASPLVQIRKWHSPSFTLHPEGARKYRGESHVLRVVPNSQASTMHYQWKCERADKTVFSGPTVPEWPLDALTVGDAGSYWCEVSYDGETLSSEVALLEVQERLTITRQPEGGRIQLGDSHRLLVEFQGGYAPLAFIWYKDGEPQSQLDGVADLLLSDLIPEDSGVYHLVISDAHGSTVASRGVELIIRESFLSLYGTVSIRGLFFLLFLTGSLMLYKKRDVS